METLIQYGLLVTSILLCAIVVVQSKGTWLSIAPGTGDFGKFEKRGAEKTLHTATIVLAVAFTVLSVAHFFLG